MSVPKECRWLTPFGGCDRVAYATGRLIVDDATKHTGDNMHADVRARLERMARELPVLAQPVMGSNINSRCSVYGDPAAQQQCDCYEPKS